MTRLIDKDLLIEILGEMQGLCDTKAALIQNSKIWQQVKDLPTVDAVPVIRCKDCRFCNRENAVGEWQGSCRYWNTHSVMFDDWCSRAEREEE